MCHKIPLFNFQKLCSAALIYIAARDQSIVESGVTEGGKNTASFLFREWTQQHKHEASS